MAGSVRGNRIAPVPARCRHRPRPCAVAPPSCPAPSSSAAPPSWPSAASTPTSKSWRTGTSGSAFSTPEPCSLPASQPLLRYRVHPTSVSHNVLPRSARGRGDLSHPTSCPICLCFAGWLRFNRVRSRARVLRSLHPAHPPASLPASIRYGPLHPARPLLLPPPLQSPRQHALYPASPSRTPPAQPSPTPTSPVLALVPSMPLCASLEPPKTCQAPPTPPETPNSIIPNEIINF